MSQTPFYRTTAQLFLEKSLLTLIFHEGIRLCALYAVR